MYPDEKSTHLWLRLEHSKIYPVKIQANKNAMIFFLYKNSSKSEAY